MHSGASVCLSVCLSLSICLSVRPPVCPFVHLSVRLSVCLVYYQLSDTFEHSCAQPHTCTESSFLSICICMEFSIVPLSPHRITYTKDIDRLLRSLQVAEEDPSPKDNFSSPPPVATITVSQTKLQTVHIVLPVHANHHGTTFGGQVSCPFGYTIRVHL